MKDTHSHNHYPEEKWLQSITALLPCFALWWRYDLLCLRQVKCAGKRSLRPPSSMSVSVILRSLFWLRSQQRYLPWQRSINQSAELAKSHRSGSSAAWTDEVRRGDGRRRDWGPGGTSPDSCVPSSLNLCDPRILIFLVWGHIHMWE